MIRRITICTMSLVLFAASTHAAHPVRFDVRLLAVDLNEGRDIADFDGD